MIQLFKKLNYKDQKEIYIINAPEFFNKRLQEIEIKINSKYSSGEKIDFILIFAKNKVEIDKAIESIKTSLADDAILWFAYPKKSSKKYNCDFNRDTGWDSLGRIGYEGVRMIAIDEDWSAIRFRNAKFIKSMTRRQSMTLSETGKIKTKGK
jgi:uncharacterized protein (DUF2344 family)